MAKSEAVKVVGAWSSPFAMRPLIALKIKSVEYECLEEEIGCKSEFLLKSNPVHKKIPVLIHGDKLVCESLIIVEYIDEVWSSAPSILPSDPYDRATAKFWAAFVDDKFFPSMKESNIGVGEEAKKAGLDQMVDVLALLEDAYVKCSKGKPFFGGNQIGYLDIALGCFLGWLRVSEKSLQMKLLDEAKTPGLVNWAESFCAHPAVKDVMPQTDQLIEVSKFIAKLRAASAADASAPPK
ncbi:hypothetical protein Dsin_010169 [Dipteronia sinensis]|uniref:Glutathione S-transferase n=1 Tax=Dipteronia sinensis TaxID=43782 RepID=A0AAE0AT59_9ROSI|nr:hypothetical protein Dsin_010169 [Dipteronia sinensis]